MGFLTDAELASLRVQRMILHVVGRRDEAFRPEPEIAVQQEAFFRGRIVGQAGSGVHSFTEHSQVKPIVEAMAQGQSSFEAGAQELSRLFWRDHVKQSTAGAFFVFQLVSDIPNVSLYAMIKYDYKSAVELAQEDGQNILREIIQAFVNDRKAVQKHCMIRVVGGIAEDVVSAGDRMKEAPDLTDYFEKYLGVERSRSTLELSNRLNEAMRATCEEIRDVLPEQDVGEAMAKAKAALQGLQTVSNTNVVEVILHAAGGPQDETVRLRIERVTRRKLRVKDLEDVEFRPDRRTLQAQPRRVVRTAEEVRIEYPDEELGRSVQRRAKPAGGFVFTIETARELVQDTTLPIRVRDAAR